MRFSSGQQRGPLVHPEHHSLEISTTSATYRGIAIYASRAKFSTKEPQIYLRFNQYLQEVSLFSIPKFGMASVSAHKSASPLPTGPTATRDVHSTFTQHISRAIMTASRPKPAKLRANLDSMPPAPPPSPVSFAIDSNGKANSMSHEKIPNLNLD